MVPSPVPLTHIPAHGQLFLPYLMLVLLQEQCPLEPFLGTGTQWAWQGDRADDSHWGRPRKCHSGEKIRTPFSFDFLLVVSSPSRAWCAETCFVRLESLARNLLIHGCQSDSTVGRMLVLHPWNSIWFPEHHEELFLRTEPRVHPEHC